MSAGKFFQALSEHAHDRADKQRSEMESSKKSEIDIWRKVLEDPYSNDVQRQKAVENLNKLYSMKKGASPFEKLAGFMKMVGGKMQGQPGQTPGQTPGAPGTEKMPGKPGSGGPMQNMPAASGQKQEMQPLNGQAAPAPDPNISAGKRNFAQKALGKVASGLGSGMEAFSGMINPHPKELPPLDAASFPNQQQQREGRAADLKSELETREPFIEKQIKLRGEEAQKTARERARNAMNSKTKYPGSSIVNAISDEAMKGKLVDSNNLPVDPNGLYAPIAGEAMSIQKDDDGTPVLTAVRVGTGSAREGEYGQIVIDPKTNDLVEIPIHRKTNTPEPPKQSSPRLDGSKPGESSKPVSSKKHEAAMKPLQGGEKSTTMPKGARVIGSFVRPQQFNPLQKQATATDEARNSLIGDDPKKPGGLMADLGIFKDPEKTDRVMKYLGFIEKNLAGEGSRATGTGPAAAIEWYTGLPTAISNLQQQAQKELALSLEPDEQRFVSDYFRVMGTIGGMRASTGMPAARWSFQTLYNELPTPGKVTDAGDAKRRIQNLIQETNVVAKRNPLSTVVPIEQQDAPELPAHWKQELDKKPKNK